MNLENVVTEEIKKIIDSGKVNEIVNKQLTKTIESSVDDVLCSYSGFGRALKEKMSKSLAIDLDNVSIPEYQALICSFIRTELDKNMNSEGKEKLKNVITNFLKPLEKDEYSLEDIAKKFQEECKNAGYSDNETCTIIHKISDDNYHWLYLDEDENKSKYSCKYQIGISTDKIFDLQIDDADMSEYKGHAIFNIDRFLFQLYTSGTKINCDDFDTEEYSYIGHDYD